MNKAAINTHVQVLGGTYIFCLADNCSGIQLVGCMVVACFDIFRKSVSDFPEWLHNATLSPAVY